MSCVEYKTNEMSMKNQTQLVVNCSNNTSKPLIESEKFQVIAPTPKVPLRGRCSSDFAQDDQSCSSVKNPWLLRVTVVFTLAVAIVVFAALHNKLRTSLQTTSLEVERLKNTIVIFEGQINELQRRYAIY